MDKDIVVKVTRLRNTLPLETEDVKSPSTQSTPTKKRGGRLTTKPQLELIHENATEEIQPKKTRKSTAKVVEPDEKVMTPSRRSTRIRSNTSNVSETPTEAEDKGTPSRRSTRIRSNTSLIAETAQFENSPRARRAARRTSLVGSDNESTVTPVKQTRRTRRDSTSSIDKKAGSNVSKLEIQPNLVIIEEKTNKDEDETKAKDASSEDINDSPNIRKSPRLVEKSAKQSLSRDGNNKENEPHSVKTDEKSNSDIKTDNFVESSTVQIEQNIVNEVNNLSKSSSNFSSDLGIKSKKKNPALNYTTSALDKPKSESKRQRTKSWTTISSSRQSDHCFLSDSEAMKKKPTMEDTTYKSYNTSGSGDGLLNASKDKGDKNNSFNHSAISENITNSNRISTTTSNTEVMNLDNSTSKLNHSSDKNDSKQYGRVVLGNSPKCLVKSIVFLEDSDSNASNTDKVNVNYGTNAEDQCVPVVKHQLQVAESQNNLSYEPMDIDETITENASLLIFTNNNPAQETQNNSILLNNSHDNNTKEVEKFSSKTSDLEDDKDRSLNKSKKMSDKDITSDDNEKVCKSKRKSSNSSIKVVKRENDTNLSKTYSTSFTITNNDDITKSSSNMEADCNMSINANKLSFNQDHDNTTKVIKSNRKSSICDTSADGNNVKKSNRKSLINNIDNNTSILSSGLVKVDYKCIEEPMCDDHDIINDPKKRSKRISLSADGEVEHPKSKDDGSKISNDDTINISSNNCNMRSSLKNVHDIMEPNANNSKRDSLTSNDIINVKNSNVAENETMTDVINKHESKSKGSKKDKRSIMSNKDNDNADESVNISSRKSSISQASSSQSLDNSNNENKSTLVLSQIKNTSETNFEYNEPLSKSLDVSIVKKDIEKKNLSIAYSTSTPLQQKSSKNSGMQINTSNISSEKKDVSIKGNKKATVLPNHEETQSSNEDNVEEDSDENDEEETEDKSIFIDAEAKDANDDYESGDSRDEDEKEYEEQNEIIEEGESLDSEEEEDFSDDSEYEKDSFVVDSDEEDNNLLSGSDNDLSMSADELTMSAKSKNKFNARKVKEQKKASREMFNARHEGNESSNSISNKHITKKVNRQRLESSDSDVEKEKHNLQPKRSKRARIDSSQDISMNQSDADKLVSVKKKKIRCLSDSVCEDNAVENEITIDKSISPDNIDPLSLQNVVKQEPNISQKDLNISTIAITNADEFEKVEIDVNVSLIRAKSNLSLDPLQNTMAQDNARDSEESISENEEITKGYDSVLNNLNTIKLKTADTSLNIHKKGKPKSKEPIVDELNLTQIKSKKAKNKLADENAEKQNVSQKITNKIMANITNSTNHDEDSSDSIDMKLLFNDSSDSENKITVEEVPESYIPLKRTEGKINILESIGGETENVSFFIDTTGTHTENMKDENNDDSSVKTSGKKKKKTSTSFADTEQAKDTEQPLNISITGSTKKKKNKLSSTFDKQETESESHISISSNDKKEKNKVPFDEQRTGEPELNISVTDSNKKKKNKLSLSVDEQNTGQQELNISVTGSKKKNKLHLSFDEQETAEPTAEEAVINTSASNVKKQKQKNTSKNIVENDILGEPVLEQAIDDEPVYSVKKQKHKDTSKSLVELENVIEGNEIVTDLTEEATSQKRKRKRSANHSISQEAIQNSDTLKLPNESVIASNDKKKRKFSHKEDDTATISQDITKKDKKRKHSDNDDNVSKDNKHDSSEKHLVPRLPTKILKQLDDKPKKDNNLPKGNFISTTSFKVEKTDKKRMKPSNYLEQSVYLNDSIEEETKKSSLFQPKVCPSVPTVSLSNQGFTTNFKVDVIPQNTQFIFIGKSNDVPNFKQDFLHKHRIKKFGTFDMYKRRRNAKLSKF